MESPFSAQLGTNYCPTDEDIPVIKALLAEPALRLKHLDDEIAQLRKAIDKLAEERTSLVAYIEGHEALVSPVRRLPLDVIQEIFLACAPSHRNCVMSASEAPVLLTRVCSSWRAIAFSTPRLWARIHIVEPQRFQGGDLDSIEAKAAQRFEVLQAWLGRSGNCPLSISLIAAPEDTEFMPAVASPSPTKPFLQALVPFARRWQHVELTLSPIGLESISRITASDVPLLESFKLQHDYQFPPRRVDLANFGILQGPNLVSFCVLGNDIISETLPLRWNQLTVLAMTTPGAWQTAMTSESVMQLLWRCPELRTCRFSVNDRIESGSYLPAVELKSMHTLDLQCEVVGLTLPRLLDRLSLPELRHFSLSGQAGVDPADRPSLAKAFARWSRLETLELTGNTFSKSSLLETLRSLPDSLQQLKIHDIPNTSEGPGIIPTTCLDDKALAILTPDDNSVAPVCPALHIIHIEYCTDISDAALLRFITARMSPSVGEPKLKRVKFQFSRYSTLDILPDIQPFIESGLDISITHILPFKTQSSPWQGLDDQPLLPNGPWGYTP
ncbi:hypothetical protein C8R46DRAFT_1106833 [Mycena filopes]|nr:hypothetical protein C8R46DRAFT_1106833 [Mycena filopes]